MSETDLTSTGFVAALDRDDPLAPFRDRFFYPEGKIYLLGNSLGLMPKAARASIERVTGEWEQLAIDGWMHGNPPWFWLAERLGERMAPLMGAEAEEVIATGTTTVNLHALTAAFYEPKGRRTKILTDSLAFPSDAFALQGQVRLHGLDPAEHLVLIPNQLEILTDEAIAATLTGEVALVVLPAVVYRSGQRLDIQKWTRLAHNRGILVGVDCSHAAGIVPHRLHDWEVDFAVWCGYKYLNGGPGCSAFLFVHRRHFHRTAPLAGWFGSKKEKQFTMSLDLDKQETAGGWQISSPGIIGSVSLEASLATIQAAGGISPLREKSLRLTGYLIDLADRLLSANRYGISVVTPRQPERRGGHVALRCGADGLAIAQALKSRGVIVDFRAPDLIRLAPSPLYNTFSETRKAVLVLKEIIDSGAHEPFRSQRPLVT